MPEKHVFISYSRQDRAVMVDIKQSLADAGIPLWTDMRIKPGTPRWQLAIEAAIRNAYAVVVLLSPDSKASEWVGIEISVAKSHNIPIIPVLLRGSKNKSVPIEIFTYQHIDLSTDYEAGIDALVHSLSDPNSLAGDNSEFVSTPIPVKDTLPPKKKLFSFTIDIPFAIKIAVGVAVAFIIFGGYAAIGNNGFIFDQATPPIAIISTATPTMVTTPTSTPVTLPTATQTSTLVPTEISYDFGLDIQDNCIADNLWQAAIGRPDVFEARPQCLDLSEYGYLVEDGVLKVIDPKAEQRIVSQVDFEDGYITFDLVIRDLYDSFDLEPYVYFAIVNNDLPQGIYFGIQRKSIEENFLRGVWFSIDQNDLIDGIYPTSLIFNLNQSYNITFVVDDRRVSVEVDGVPELEDLAVQFSSYEFLIGHAKLVSFEVVYYISNLEFHKE